MSEVCLTYREPGGTPSVRLPLSKSIAARLMVLAHLAGSDPGYLVEGEEPMCDDLRVMLSGIRAIRRLGGQPGIAEIDLRDSGTAKHLLTTLCACTPGLHAVLRQSPRLARRPSAALAEALRIYSSGKVSFRPDGSIDVTGGEYTSRSLPAMLDTSRSSQVCTALMLLASTGERPTRLFLPLNGVSTPYIRMTASLMRACGLEACYDPSARFLTVVPGPCLLPATELLEADWSAAAFFYLFALASGIPLSLSRLKRPEDSVQGDSAAAALFAKLGVASEFTPGGAVITPGALPQGASLDVSLRDCPDLVPPLAVACALARVPFLFRGIAHLRLKESDRLKAISEALSLCGLKVDIGPDSLSWDGRQTLQAPSQPISTCADHRIAMAFAMTAPRFPGIRLDDLGCADKSFPAFKEQIQRLGVLIK